MLDVSFGDQRNNLSVNCNNPTPDCNVVITAPRCFNHFLLSFGVGASLSEKVSVGDRRLLEPHWSGLATENPGNNNNNNIRAQLKDIVDEFLNHLNQRLIVKNITQAVDPLNKEPGFCGFNNIRRQSGPSERTERGKWLETDCREM
ncbi:hypothetical protein EYF80_043722 [Liparis tanakae]|uniref:Uncharacterized protein n=1 Tax=Liparis tanakae TaxID=230148 RepID=A0A4Z2FXN8_9TELE|nr:hypothetical protein EYF80_043722 [Liparis tanakae]